MTVETLFLEIGGSQCRKHGENVCGDAFQSQKIQGENRVVSVLSDGLGSGVKASILSIMTATMAMKYVAINRDIRRASGIIMKSLPVCQVRGIRYATFTVVDTVLHGLTRMMEMGNPSALLIRDNNIASIARHPLTEPKRAGRDLTIAEIATRPNDRIVVFSDGITQAGLGTPDWKLGWREGGCAAYVKDVVTRQPDISARNLADLIVKEALRKEQRLEAKDDMTCAVLYFRTPRRLLIVSGPPYDRAMDAETAWRVTRHPGRVAVCGGTTANILARELKTTIRMDLRTASRDLPPTSVMDGVELITEGILTLTRTAQYLDAPPAVAPDNAAGRLYNLLMDSDIIEFLVGTRINEAHQDPSLPADLEIRRNIVKRMAASLNVRHLKETSIQYI